MPGFFFLGRYLNVREHSFLFLFLHIYNNKKPSKVCIFVYSEITQMKKIILLIILLISSGFINAQSLVTVIAGNGISGYSGDGGPATDASIRGSQGVCMDSIGNLYIADAGRVRKINPSGIITTIAGTGASGYSGDGGPATAAQLNFYGVECDPAGNLLIGDWYNNRVRRVDAVTGIITTIAGDGTYGSGGDGGPATAAQIREPIEANYDDAHNIYISEYGSAKIRKVDAVTGIISTIASGENGPDQIAIRGNTIYVALQSGSVIKINSLGDTSTFAGGGSDILSNVPATNTELSGPQGVAIDCFGNIYIADNDNDLVRRVDISTNIITTIAGGGVLVPTIAGVPALNAKFHNELICFGHSGNMYVTTDEASVVYMISNVGTCKPSCDTGLIASFSILPTIQLIDTNVTFINSSSDATHYLWDFGDNTTSTEASPTHQYNKTGSHNICLTAFNDDKCLSNICKDIYTEEDLIVGIPSAFSPNGDGANDKLYARGKGIKTIDLKVYNRFGQLVFETTDINIGWDGKFRGQDQPIDTYACILYATCIDGSVKTVKKNVTLLR